MLACVVAFARWLATRRGAGRTTAADGRPGERSVAGLAAAGLGCAIGPALVQWPVTRSVLVSPEALVNPANLRFYYLALAGVLMIVAALAASRPKARTRNALVASVALLASICWAAGARVHAKYWEAITNGPAHAVDAAAARLVAKLDVAPGCRLYLRGDGLPDEFVRFSDVSVKASVMRGSPVATCVVVGNLSPWYTVTREQPCVNEGWQPLLPREKGGVPIAARRVGNLCYHYFGDPAPGAAESDPKARRFVWNGKDFVEESRPAVK